MAKLPCHIHFKHAVFMKDMLLIETRSQITVLDCAALPALEQRSRDAPSLQEVMPGGGSGVVMCANGFTVEM